MLAAAAVQEEVLSESKEKSESAQRGPRRRMGRKRRKWRSSGRGAVVLWSLVLECRGEG